MTRRCIVSACALVIVLAALAAVWLPRSCTYTPPRLVAPDVGTSGLTFFAWSDQHVKADGDCSHLFPVVDAMNGLPGSSCPPPVNSVLPSPAFVFGCGDCTDWPTKEAAAFTRKLFEVQRPAVRHARGNGIPAR